jgi:hypothetical protein
MGKGSLTKREEVRRTRTIKRNALLKKATHKTYIKPEGWGGEPKKPKESAEKISSKHEESIIENEGSATEESGTEKEESIIENEGSATEEPGTENEESGAEKESATE